MKICIIGSNKRIETDNLLIQTAEKFGEIIYIPIEDISLLIDNGINFTYEYKNITENDVILFRIPKSKYSLAGMIIEALPETTTLLNSPRCFYTCCSKIPFYEKLSRSGINVPKSIFADNPQAAISDLKFLRFPVMIKVPTGKEKVMLANSEQEVRSMVDALQVLKQPMLLEEYYPDAKVISVLVLDGEAIAAIERTPSSINYIGGEIKKSKINRKIINTSLDIAAVLNTEYAQVDILNTAEPTVIDVNLCPDILKFSDVHGINLSENLFSVASKKFDSNQHIPELAEKIKKVFNDVF